MSRPEILAPAGNREMLGAAVFSGADAVYLGLTGFNARRTAGNYTPDELREAVAFCHARGVKGLVSLNTLVYDRELSGLADAVRAVAAAGADAVIADDLATAQLVKSIAPTLHLHGSTQMSVHTPEGAKELAALGYARVILARELSLEEIRADCEASPIEVEGFVHGALCMSVSGQCMMSAFLGGRSGNRGACAGPRRRPFDASAGLKTGQPGRASHLSLKDMDYIPHLRELMDAGVASVKIEGRLRTPEYAAAVVTACRAVCAGQPYDEKLVRDIFSRSGFTDGYLTNRNDGKMFGVRTEADAAATRAATRPTVRLTRPASRDHRHTRRASSGAPKNAAPPDSGRPYLPPRPCSSSAKSFSAPGRHVAKHSKLCTWLVIIHSYEGRIEEFGQNGPRMSSHRTAGESSSAFYPINYRNTSNSWIRNS